MTMSVAVKNRAVLKDFAKVVLAEAASQGITLSETTREKITKRAVERYFGRRGSAAKSSGAK
jgi:hypothetical protein